MTTQTFAKPIKAALYTTPAEFLEAVQNAANAYAPHMGDAFFQAMQTNFPDMETPEGPASVLGWTENPASPIGFAPVFADTFKAGSLAIVPIYGTGTGHDLPEGKPLAPLAALKLLHLPSVAQIGSMDRLRGFFEEIARAALKTAAGRIAKMHEADAGKHPLLSDPVQMLLASLRPEKQADAWRRMFPIAREILVAAGTARAKQAEAAGQTVQARQILAVFNKSLFTADSLKTALSSEEGAKHLFPQLPQTLWNRLLDALIKAAPDAKKSVQIKDSDGNPAKDDEGKALRQTIAAPVSPALFLGWKQTRAETPFTKPDASFMLDGLTF